MAKCSGSIAIIEVSDGLTTFYQYAYNTSGTTAPTSGWSQSVPASAAGRFVWRREGTALSYDDVTSWGNEVCLTGATGATGATGNGISSIVEYYAVSASNSTAPSSWSTSMPTLTATNKYLWNYTRYTYTGGTYVDTTKIVIGTYGDKGDTGSTGSTGVGVSSIAEKYAASSSNSTEPTSWQDTVPTLTATNRYLWNYEIFTLTNGTTTNTKKRVIGVYGDKGATGATGATGNGISSIVNYYLASASGSGITNASSGFTSSIQTLTTTLKYLWNYELITYTNGTTAKSPACVIGVYGDKGATGATGPKGDKGDKGDTGAAAKSVSISAPDLYWHFTGRGALTDAAQAITLTANAVNFTPASYQWYRNNTAISGATTATYTVPSRETGVYKVIVDGTYPASVTVGSVTDGASEGMYLGVLATAGDAASWTAAYGGYKVPSGKFSGQNLAEGDYYVYNNGGTVTNYYFNGANFEIASGDNLSLFINAFWDVLNLGTTQASGSFYTLFAQYFMAMEAVIVALGASQIHIQTLSGKSGCIYGGSYNADGTCSDTSAAGFWLGESGDFKCQNGYFTNISATGYFSLSDGRGVVFESTKDTNADAVSGSVANDSYLVSDVAEAVVGEASGTSLCDEGGIVFAGVSYGSRITKCASNGTLLLEALLDKTYAYDGRADESKRINEEFTCTTGGECAIAYAIRLKWLDDTIGERGALDIWKNGTKVVTLHTQETGGLAVTKTIVGRTDVPVAAGDVICLVVRPGSGSYGWVGDQTLGANTLKTLDVGYLYAFDASYNIAKQVPLSQICRNSEAPLSIHDTTSSRSASSSDHLTMFQGSDALALLTGGTYDCDTASPRNLTLGTATYTDIRTVIVLDGSVMFVRDTSDALVISRASFYTGPLAFTFTPTSYKAGIKVRNVNAVGSSPLCGTPAFPFSDGYFEAIHPAVVDSTTINATTLNGSLAGDSAGTHTGNVNAAGTAFKVWGAVAN